MHREHSPEREETTAAAQSAADDLEEMAAATEILAREFGAVELCEVCDRSPDPCDCDLRCYHPDHPDPDDYDVEDDYDEAAAEHDEEGCQTERALRRCRHRGPLYIMRGLPVHEGCQPAGWKPDPIEARR